MWPRQVHTIFTDRDKNVWVAGSAPGDTLVKFSPDGKFLRDFGNRGPVVERQGMIQNNQSKILLLGVSSAALDEAANEIFIADGYLNRRVTVFDLATGAFKRALGRLRQADRADLERAAARARSQRFQGGGFQVGGPLHTHCQ